MRLRAAENDLSPSLLASRATLEQIVRDGAPPPGGWRGELIGADLRALLSGQAVLRVEDGSLRLGPAGPDSGAEA